MSDDAIPDEREVKLSVVDDFVVPSFDALDGATVEDCGEQTLDAVYWDTADLALAHHGVGLRHRNGTWTYKGRTRHDGAAVVRSELEVVGAGAAVPAAIHDAVGGRALVARLRPVVEVVTDRRTIAVRRGDEHVELARDRVVVASGGSVVDRFTALEVEYEPGSSRLATEVVDTLLVSGAVLDRTAKYVRAHRAIGHDVPEVLEGTP